jgi:hypothetical protein
VSVVASLLHSLRFLVRSRAALHLEVVALRHQLVVTSRSRRPRLRLTALDRVLWAWLSHRWRGWRSALHVVQPATVVIRKKTMALRLPRSNPIVPVAQVSSPHVLRTPLALLADLLRLLRLMLHSRMQLAAENLFLRKQLACYIERQVRPRRTDNGSRITLVLLSQFVDWRELLTIVRPDTLVRWHRDLFRLFWWLKSRQRGRPPIPFECSDSSRTWPLTTTHGVRSALRRNSA